MSELSDDSCDSDASSGSVYSTESVASSSSVQSDASLGRGQRIKKRKRHDDSIMAEREAKEKSQKRKKTGEHKSKSTKKKETKKNFKPFRIEKDENKQKSTATGSRRVASIEKSKQLAALEAKQPVSGDMIVTTTISPDKDYYKGLLAKLMKERNEKAGPSKPEGVPFPTESESTQKILHEKSFQSSRKSVPLNETSGDLLGGCISQNEAGPSEGLDFMEEISDELSVKSHKADDEGDTSQVGNQQQPFISNPKHIPFEDQLLFSKEDDGVVELRKKTGIYVKKSALDLIKASHKTHSSKTRALMEAVFTEDALVNCSLKGKVAKGPKGKPAVQRNALNPQGIQAILDYAKRQCQKQGIAVHEELWVRKQMATKQSEIRKAAGQ